MIRVHGPLLAVGLLVFCLTAAIAMGEACAQADLAVAVGKLQPGLTSAARGRWSRRLSDHPRPYLLAAVVFRESSFSADVYRGRKRGRAGEIGAMQIHPASGWRGFVPDGCPRSWDVLADRPACSFRTGVRAFAFAWSLCPSGSWWVKVAAYKWGRCLSEPEAKRDKSTRNARRFYCRIKEGCDVSWPL